MGKGTVVFIPCALRRGGFPSERVFIIRARGGGELSGVADAGYCYRQDGSPIGDEPPEGEEIEGRLLGLVVRMLGEASVRVHLPDGEVYDLDQANVIPAREATSRHVPV
jgi:hypothetical protein